MLRSTKLVALLALALLVSIAVVSGQGDAEGEAGGDADATKEVEALKAKLAAAEDRARAAEEGAKAAEAELQKMRQHASETEQELGTKSKELEEALNEQKKAAQAIKDASSQTETLSQAKVSLEEKIAKLESDLHSTSSDQNKVATLENELESMRKKLATEKEAKELVIKLRQEKEELKAQLDEAKNNIVHHAQNVWLPQAQESLRNLTEGVSTHASIAASTISEVLNEAESKVAEGLEKLEKDQRMETVRVAAKPYLDDSKLLVDKLWIQMKEQVRHPLPWMREGVENAVAGFGGALARYKNDWADASDYWLVILPLIFVWWLICISWMSELRLYCLRVQSATLLIWISIALLALLQRKSTLHLLSDALSPPQLAAFHMLLVLHLAIVSSFYALNFLFGPNRFAAILQLAASVWVLWCYYQQLAAPFLVDPAVHSKLAASFTTPHMIRMLFAWVLANWGFVKRAKKGPKVKADTAYQAAATQAAAKASKAPKQSRKT